MASKHAVLALIKALNVKYRNDYDRLIIANHAYLLTQGFHAVAVGKTADTLSDIKADAPEVDLDGWQDLEQAYSFAYVKSEGSKPERVQVTGLEMDQSLVIHFLSPGSEFRPSTAELPVKKFVGTATDVAGGLISVDELLDRLKSALESATHQPSQSEQKQTAANEAPSDASPLREPTTDATERALRGLREMPPVGGDDFRPGGIPHHLPGRPGIIGDPDDPGMLGGGGMHVGPDHPIFARRFPGRAGIPQGPMPGVRFDPMAPEGMPGFNAHDFQRTGRRFGHPDLEPPGRGFGDPSFGSGFREL